MRHIAAYLLAVLGGNAHPDAAAIKAILASAEIEPDNDKINKLIEELKGKDLEQVIAEGQAKLSAVPSGGGGGAATTTHPPQGGNPPAKPAEAEKEEKEEQKEEEDEDEDMGFGLFE